LLSDLNDEKGSHKFDVIIMLALSVFTNINALRSMFVGKMVRPCWQKESVNRRSNQLA